MTKATQTAEMNRPLIEELSIARSLQHTAQSCLEDALNRMYVPGARIVKCGFRGRRSYFTVLHPTLHPSKWFKIRNNKTGSERLADLSDRSFELCEYSYRVFNTETGEEVPNVGA